ncbi:MAG: hypothetical protein R3E39_14860 [Anaerolineae bacterium]
MPRRYRPHEKAAALQTLDACLGDIVLAADRTGIPERTLRDWRNQREKGLPLSPPFFSSPPPPPKPDLPIFEDDMQRLAFMREQILAELVNISANLKDSFAQTAPHRRLRVLSDLMDRLMKLDLHLQPYQPEERIVMSWSCGIYVRTPTERHGPFDPGDLPSRWRESFGPQCDLEIYWGDGTATPIPEGPFMDQLMITYNIEDNRQRPVLAPQDMPKDEYWEVPDWRERLTKDDYDDGIIEPHPEQDW